MLAARTWQAQVSDVRGQVVLVRGGEGQALVRRVWDSGESEVIICTEPAFHRLEGGDSSALTETVPKTDVFVYDREASIILESGGGGIEWSSQIPWQDES